jgi:hypothetical protein
MFENGHLRWQPLSSLELLALVVHEAALNQAPVVEPPAGAAKPVIASSRHSSSSDPTRRRRDNRP